MPVLKLTAAAIPSLRPKDDRREETYRDTVVPGLLLEVHPSGRRTFVAWGRIKGTDRAVRVTLGCWQPDVYGLADARDAAKEALHLLATGRDPAAEKRQAKEAGTFGQLAESFLREAQIRESTREEWGRLLRHSRLAGLRARRTTLIVRGELVRLFDKIRQDALRNGERGISANRTLEAVRRCFSWAVQKDLLPASPCVAVLKPTKEEPRRRIYDDRELGAIVRALRGDGSAMADACLLALLTGTRIEQALGAPWSEFDLEKGERVKGKWVPRPEWLIAGERTGTKNALPWLVPLVPAAVEVLERRRNETPFVFPTSRGGTVWRSQRAVDRVCEASGVPDFRPHDLRRCLNTWLASLAGGAVAQPVRDSILGHKPPGLEAVYNVHSYAQEKRTALDRWAKHVDRVAQAEQGKVIEFPA